MVNSSTATPGRPSIVSSGDSVRSMPASAPQAITEVANPVMVRAAISAHSKRRRGDDDPRADHGEGLGEGLDDGDAFELQVSHGTVAKSVWSGKVGTPNRAGSAP